jgi:glycogen operon protein
VTVGEGGANVAVVSRHAERVFICIFDETGDIELARFALPGRLGDVHYGFVDGLTAGMRYGLRAEGPWAPEDGHRFDATKLLVDPYATRIDRPFRHHGDLTQRGVDTAHLVPKCIVAADDATCAPRPVTRPGFIYELPVKAFTMRHPEIPEAKRGTISALAEPCVLAHLTSLGVDTVELMPLAAWIDERHLAGLGLANAWGYNPVTFMAPDPRLAPGGLADVRAAVEALHGAGLQVVLDVVFNHTGESDAHGATLSLRGLDNALYYRHDGGTLVNDTGCGNTLALDHPATVQLVMDAMRSWVLRAGIDGFRFDLATVMGRTATGFDPEAPLLAAIEQDPLLRGRAMIAEPWDVGPGGYQLGRFPARWQEWNDRYKDDVRRFWRGDAGAAGAFATRLAGSSDVFDASRGPWASINYIAAHDGFTLRDAVTYREKHNHANGEGNRDGNAHEPTWPGGNVRALLATLFLSRGTPMLTAGDEFGRSQGGNNNAYAQDNDVTWLDWAAADGEVLRFTTELAALRKAWAGFFTGGFLTGLPDPDSGLADAAWIAADGRGLDWADAAARVVGLVLAHDDRRLTLWFNRGTDMVMPRAPAREGWRWSRIFSSGEGPGVPPQSVAVFAEERLRGSGISDDRLGQLARAAGIEPEWWEVDGTHHVVTPDTLRHLLAAVRLGHATAHDVEDSLHQLRARPRPLVVQAGAAITLGPATDRRRQMIVASDSGEERRSEVSAGDAPRLELAPGYHRVWWAEDPDRAMQVIASPGSCHLPDDIAAGRRVFGIAAHLYALRHEGDGGIGDFETLRRLAEVTARSGGRYAGLNPLHHMFPSDRSRVSPYQPSDRRYIDPIYISIPRLLESLKLPATARLAEKHAAGFARLESLSHVDYAAVWSAKQALLEEAFREFRGSPDFAAFVAAGGAALKAHGQFEAEKAGETPSRARIAYRAFLQWVAEGQLAAAAQRKSLYRDLALGSAFDGGEIAEALADHAEGVSLGAPPDPFSPDGQVWNLPPFSPLALAARGFAPLRSVLQANMRHAAALRIDHILGFMRQFWVPRGAAGAAGAYVNFPLDAMIAVTAIESRRRNCLVVGEDLGTIPDGLRERLQAANILSYRVLWFERDGTGFRPPASYPALALACLASHDLPTFRGWREGLDIAIDLSLERIDAGEAERRRLRRADETAALDAVAQTPTHGLHDASVAAHGLVAKTPSRVMLVQADDLADAAEPLNVPGTDTERPNWRRRLTPTVEALATGRLAADILARVKAERGP